MPVDRPTAVAVPRPPIIVVHQPCRPRTAKPNVVGNTPTNLAAIFTVNSAATVPRPATTAGSEINVPALRKKNGVRNEKAVPRIRPISRGSWWKVPAATRPSR